ncbi:MAG TPA: hypothetical protein HPP80_01410 [Rhodospirillaceae bacterium]|nr:hypothetical protein [Rhodospirillaceae bacterium]
MSQIDRYLTAILILGGGVLLGLWLLAGPSREQGSDFESLGADAFRSGLQRMVAEGEGGLVVDGHPLIRVRDDDIFLLARRWEFSPAIELRAHHTYHLHLMAEDVVHSAVIAGSERLLLPGQPQSMTLTTAAAGQLAVQCAEFCGFSHNLMAAFIKISGDP